MSKTILTILAFLGIIVIYIFALIIATMIATYIFVKDDPDDYDYAMTANIMQFLVIMIIVAYEVEQWIN